MRIRATKPEGRNAGAPGAGPSLPWGQSCIDEEGASIKSTGGIGLFKIDRGRESFVLQCEHRLDQAGNSRGGVQMADVSFERADGTPLVGLSARAQGSLDRLDFDRVAFARACPMRLDIVDCFGRNLPGGQSLLDGHRLPLGAWRGVAAFVRPVVIDRRPSDHRSNGITITQSSTQRFEDNNAQSRAKDRPASTNIERSRGAIRRVHSTFLEKISRFRRNAHGHASGEGHLALSIRQALTGHVNRYKRSRTGGLHSHGGSPQVQLERDPRREKVTLTADNDLVILEHLWQRWIAADIALEIGVSASAGKDSNLTRIRQRITPGIFEGVPGAFQKQAMLRIGDLRLAGRHAEKGGVEEFDPLEDGGGTDIARVETSPAGDAR